MYPRRLYAAARISQAAQSSLPRQWVTLYLLKSLWLVLAKVEKVLKPLQPSKPIQPLKPTQSPKPVQPAKTSCWRSTCSSWWRRRG